jgi:hypothetical protein
MQEHSHNLQQGNSAEGGDQGRQDDTGMQQQPKILCVGGSVCVGGWVGGWVWVCFFFLHLKKSVQLLSKIKQLYTGSLVRLASFRTLTSSKIFFPFSPHLFLMF